MIKKNKIALYINDGAKYFRVMKSTALTIALNPETETYDYIADESSTTELSKYVPSIEQALKMHKGSEDFEYIWEKFYNLKTGEEAKTDCLIVFMFDEAGENTYKAWKADCTIVLNQLNAVDSEIGFNINFAGDITLGTVKPDAQGNPEFTPS